MRTRFGRRQIFEIFGGTVVVALGIGALTVIVLRMRKREAEDTSGEPREPTSERFGEDREHQTQSNIGTAEPLSNSLNAEAEKTQEDDTQDLTETVQQIVRETADEAIIQDT